MIKRIFKALLKRAVWSLCCCLPVNNNKIFMSSFYGKGYGGNPKYIAEELVKQNLGYEIIWVVSGEKEKKSLPEGIKTCMKGTLKEMFHIATAKVWVDDCRKAIFYKRKGQYYIQTWHGDIGLKKIEKDAENKLDIPYINMAKKDAKCSDLVISGAKWFTTLIRRAFWYDGEILECGYPRRDMLLQNDENQIREIKKELGVEQNAKILLYAPTFRAHQKNENSDFSCFDLHWQEVLPAMEEKFGGKWVGLLRLHPGVAKYSHCLNYPTGIIDVSAYPDMQELLLVSDCVISDYSSSLFEFGVTKKPGFIFALDFADYKDDRDVYFDITKLPFPFSESNEQLLRDISQFDESKYSADMDYFYHSELGICDDGTASKQIAERIKGVTGRK